MEPNTLLWETLERLRSRYFGKYRGIVAEVDEKTMRIKATVPAVLGDQTSGWCSPCVPYAGDQVGIAFLPEVGSGVWVEFEGGDVSYPIWTGCYWHTGTVPAEVKPDVKVIATVAGHKLLLDDGAGTITLTDQNSNKITLSSDGITLERGSMKIVVSDAKVDVNSGALEVV